MYHVKKAILVSFNAVITLFSFGTLFCLLNVLAGMALLSVDGLEQYKLLTDYFHVEQFFEAPVTAAMHANAPLVMASYDTAPLILAVVLLLAWAAFEAERYRLRLSVWNLDADRSFALAEEAQRRERERMLAAIEEAEARAAVRPLVRENDPYMFRDPAAPSGH